MTFNDLLNTIQSPDERVQFESIVSKYPQLKSGWLRQEDYSRKMDDFSGKVSQFEEIARYAQAWDQWKQENWDDETGTTRAELELRKIIEQKSKEEMTFDQILNGLNDKGFVTKDSLSTYLAPKEKEFQEGLQGSAYVALKAAELAGNHILEFGKPLKGTELISKLAEYGTNDLDVAYERYVAPLRKEKESKELEEKLKKVKEEAFEQGKKQGVEAAISVSRGENITPTDNSGGVGWLQQRLMSGDSEGEVNTGKLGNGLAARLAAQKYQEEKLSGAA